MELEKRGIISSPETALPELPFTYERVDEKKQARYIIPRVPWPHEERGTTPRTDEEILEEARQRHERSEWYTHYFFRSKGLPFHQFEYEIGDRPQTLYNYFPARPLRSDYPLRAAGVFRLLAAKFPKIFDECRWIIINDVQVPSAHGDPVRFPLNGAIANSWLSLLLMPRVLSPTLHRIPTVQNFEGTLVHEMTHFIEGDLQKPWGELFQWAECKDFPDEWEQKPSPDGKLQVYYHRLTGIVSPLGKFPLQPERCLNDYAKLSVNEDIAESTVAYLYEPALLQRLAPEKYEILHHYDARRQLPRVTTHQVIPVQLPLVEPCVIRYYVEEPSP